MTIVRSGSGYKIRSKKGKLLGRKGGKPYPSKAAAVKRERQIQFHKNKGKRP